MVKENNPNSLIVKYGIILLFVFHELQASLDCSFDPGYCGWQQETSDIFDWRREHFRTSSQGTGPSRDHTDGFGYYIYIEASYRHNGDTARLNSPIQEPGQYCLTFWVSMYGSNVGLLNVYIKGIKETLIFSRNGDVRDNAWRNVVLNINVPERYKIVLEGIRGNGYRGDIAIDDIAITTGTCADCNFDNGICHWTQSDSDDFDWTLQKDGTPTFGTGPTADHTSKNGQYIYTKSTNRNRGDKAWIVSPLLNSGKYCFSFWFYMYGEHVDRLKVEGIWYENGTSTELIRRTGNQGQKWIQGNIFIHYTTYFKIVFEGRVKNATWKLRKKGDIAIDDISMTSCHDCFDPTPTHASANTTNFTYGSEIKIKCDKGYTLIGESKMVCQAGGSWSVSRPTCKLYDCGNRTITNGNFNSSNGTTFGQTASQVCNNGYTVVGDTKVVCTSSGWNSTAATCTIVDCGDPTPKHGYTSSKIFEYGSVLEVRCVNGYSLIGQSSIVCQANGSWSTNPICKPLDCGNRTISHGKFIATEGTTFGQTATHVCETGYILMGDMTVTCEASGWSDTAASCTITDCGNRTIPHGKFIATEGTTFRQTATHVCDIGYTLIGAITVTCEASGWNDTSATCTVIEYTDDAERNALIAVYVLVPVVMVLAILFTICILRRRHQNCKKGTESKQESHMSSKVQYMNTMFSGQTPEYQNHTNHSDKDRSFHLNDNKAAITDDQNAMIVTSDIVYYTTGAEHALKKDCTHDYDHINKSAARQYVNDSYSHIPGRSLDTAYESSYNTTSDLFSEDHRANLQRENSGNDWLNIKYCKETIKSQPENEESDYDHAHAGGADPVAAEYDDYSHLNDAILKTTYPPSNENNEYSSVNKIMQHKEETVEKSKAGYEKPWC